MLDQIIISVSNGKSTDIMMKVDFYTLLTLIIFEVIPIARAFHTIAHHFLAEICQEKKTL